MDARTIFAVTTTAALAGTTFYAINREVPVPYLDEIFHIPQAQTYCRGEFRKWDPSITTPPGLYLISVLANRITSLGCDVRALRLANFLLGTVGLPFLYWQLINSLRRRLSFRPPSSSANQTILTTLEVATITIFPLTFFFSQLYYTDLASLVSVLVCYQASLSENRWISSAGVTATGLASLWFRQTNIVWVAFVGTSQLLRRLERGEQRFREKRAANAGKGANIRNPVTALTTFIESALANPMAIISTVIWYIPVIVAFAGFIIWNGGIVLGHQEMHVASLHYAQLPYFLAFSTLLGWPVLLDEGVWKAMGGVSSLALGSLRRIVVLAVISLLMTAAVHYGTVVHPFLLADNRHYFFYIWRRVINVTPTARYALVPVYIGSFYLWFWKNGRSQSLLWLLSFFACTSAVLIPTPLVEPRYFIVPYIILRLHLAVQPPATPSTKELPADSQRKSDPTAMRSVVEERKKQNWLLLEFGWYFLINVVTIYVFLTVKFNWPGWEGYMRFMW